MKPSDKLQALFEELDSHEEQLQLLVQHQKIEYNELYADYRKLHADYAQLLTLLIQDIMLPFESNKPLLVALTGVMKKVNQTPDDTDK